MKLQGRKIVLGISGSIAAYKSANLCRLFIKNGAEVRVIMTPSALDFISPLTLATLSNHEVVHSIHEGQSWSGHVELGLWADLFVIAPATANTIAHFTHGICSSILDAVYLSAKCPVCIAPAMDLDMWAHLTTKANMEKLGSYGVQVIPVEHGFLASGLTGDGRMAEPEHILDFVIRYFEKKQDLKGKKVMITAGPTHEKIDPVRFIGNSSSGKMGIAIAVQAQKRGAEVELVLGPIGRKFNSYPGLTVHNVISADEMYETCRSLYPTVDIAIFSAAVADYKPSHAEEFKIKKADQTLNLHLVKNVDIALELGSVKKAGQLNIGFALETNNELENAREKLTGKNFDLVVLNSTKDKGATFGSDNNKVTILGKNDILVQSELLPKTTIADIILDETINLF
ncbi:MAG: bifunctional phosphopantothenoylcysteine decarboxylase/phosphopantothenate--cysteine ligase CoaBC [Saprospiraceae bacterium]|nr:bifunctional phosphopantothenoylcysteine decarboxylase/phosphopantothenate--cysteine ligase CoaBC [Saprospiraceae bacterium]